MYTYITSPLQGWALFWKFFPRACALVHRTPLLQSSKRFVLSFYEGIKTAEGLLLTYE